MEVGGTLQDSVMSYQLMHSTALQCRRSGGFTLTLRQCCTHCLNEGIRVKILDCTITVFRDYFLQSKQCESTRMSYTNSGQNHWATHMCTLKLAFTHMKWKNTVPDTEFWTLRWLHFSYMKIREMQNKATPTRTT